MTTGSDRPARRLPAPASDRPVRADGDPPRVDRSLREISTVRSLAAPLGDVVVIVAAIAAAIALHRWYVDVAAAVVVVRSQHAIAVVMHEGAHRTLLANRRWNDIVGRWLGYGVGVSLDTYRRVHNRHHQAELSAGDPDLPLLTGYPAKGRLQRKVLRDITFRTTARNVAYLLHGASRNVSAAATATADHGRPARAPGAPRIPLLAGIGIAQLVVLGIFVAVGHPWRYVELWLLPYLLLLPPILRVRAVAEHGGKEASPDRRRSSRTTRAPLSPLSWLLAPHHVGLHVEHHLAPWVPHYRLPAVHRQLRTAGWLTDTDVHRGYVPLFRWLTTDPV
ncbi:MAG TPA: fatty acid desaturase [Mycobacteriales bacterium]|nr:fatty acid desaturase [Mycobacteriales bacterium]